LPEGSPLFWPVADLVRSYREGELSPVEVTEEALARIAACDGRLRSFLTLTPRLALEQARAAERKYRDGERGGALLGVPTAIKDLFDVAGAPTSLGSLVYRDQVADADSPVVAKLRGAGAVFLGKSNTAEFGQSATTENLLGLGCSNPWDPRRTAGGSSGGSAAAVGAGLASVSLGSDGGGSIRIPAALVGLFGIKPTIGGVADDSPFQAMTEFACPGPIVRRVADARPFMSSLLGAEFARRAAPKLKVAWCPRPQGRPVDPGVLEATSAAAGLLAELGHEVSEVELPLDGWMEAFGPLVLADEWAHRRQLLETSAAQLTAYARRSIEASARLTEADLAKARDHLAALREQTDTLLSRYDLLVTPTTAVPAFPIGHRPQSIGGQPVESLWGPFPFTAPFNVAGTPAASVPCGLADGLPVGLQLVARHGGEALLLDVCEEFEEAAGFPIGRMSERWDLSAEGARDRGDIVVERHGSSVVVRIARPAKRGALTVELLERLTDAFESEAVRMASAVVLTGESDVFSAGVDLNEVGHGAADVAVDDAVAAAATAIREAPVPVLSAIEGPCMGAAVELAVASDVLVAGRSSVFALPATRLGILYRPEALRDLAARLGHQTAARLLLVGEPIEAEAALNAGIVAEVVDSGHALEAALALAAPSGDSLRAATAATKAVLGARRGAPIPDEEEIRLDLLEQRGQAS
jgi:aspartyl-tRNA(Asn)/glutamyl-tRNA(Gln) amidotransferase subunit A